MSAEADRYPVTSAFDILDYDPMPGAQSGVDNYSFHEFDPRFVEIMEKYRVEKLASGVDLNLLTIR